MDKEIFTIGYSGFPLEKFINELKQKKINVVIDVRSLAYSKRYPDYNKPNIEKTLKLAGIYYRNYATEFGARQENKVFYSSEGYLDFDVFSKSEQFQTGVKKMVSGTEKGYKIAFMCAEKEPIQCHRAILVARVFDKMGFSVIHLLPSGAEKDQRMIEKELLQKYYPNSDQISEEECIDAAYRKQNQQIGYRLKEDQ